ncbi:MAG: hypothetical protein J6O73_05440 [Lachnospiraceae bacterium]|nr:hypothetical protein [Lachnospiraceae bacterium]
MFINLSNHPSSQWGEAQRQDALRYGEIVDIPYPQIPVKIANEEIDSLVNNYYDLIVQYDEPTVMLQGEPVFAFRLTNRLKTVGIKVLASCTERVSEEEKLEDGSVRKISQFLYGGMREY